MIDRTRAAASFATNDLEGLSGRSIAAVIARLASSSFASPRSRATRRTSSAGCAFSASSEFSGVSHFARGERLLSFLELWSRGAHVFDQCGLVLGAFQYRVFKRASYRYPGVCQAFRAAFGRDRGSLWTSDPSEGGELIRVGRS